MQRAERDQLTDAVLCNVNLNFCSCIKYMNQPSCRDKMLEVNVSAKPLKQSHI